MQTFRTLTGAYCLACLAAGLVRELVPAGESRKVIKAVSGLYILLAVLHAAGAAEEVSFTVPSLPEVPAAAQTYETDVLAQAEETLAEDCGRQLEALGIPAHAAFRLEKDGDTVAVAQITLYAEENLSPEQRRQAQDVARTYGAAQVCWAESEGSQ